MRIPHWGSGQRRRDEKAGASRKKASLARRMRRRMRRLRRRRRQQQGGGGRSAPDGGFQGDLLALHNRARPANYRLNGDLCESAQGRAKKMDAENRMYHERDWYQRIRRAGYDDRTCGENLGEGFSSAEAVMKAWLNSPAHRRNIMNGEFTEIGFGRSGNYWCAHFGDR